MVKCLNGNDLRALEMRQGSATGRACRGVASSMWMRATLSLRLRPLEAAWSAPRALRQNCADVAKKAALARAEPRERR